MRFRRSIAAAALVTVGAGAFLANTAGAKGPPTGPKGRVVSERDVTNPNETNTYAVWRNGKFHYVKVHTKRTVKVYENGVGEEVVTEDAAAVAEATKDIPAHDPAQANDANGKPKQPTAEQSAEANAVLGLTDPFPAFSNGRQHSQGSQRAGTREPVVESRP